MAMEDWGGGEAVAMATAGRGRHDREARRPRWSVVVSGGSVPSVGLPGGRGGRG